MFKKGRVQSKIYIGSTFEKDIKELDPRDACKYLGIEESHDREHKNEKETLKKEYLGRVRIVLGTELSKTNKIQATGSLVVPVLRVLELLTGAKKKTARTGKENEETANHPWTASPTGRRRSLVCSQKTRRKGPDAVRSLSSNITKLVEYVDRKMH